MPTFCPASQHVMFTKETGDRSTHLTQQVPRTHPWVISALSVPSQDCELSPLSPAASNNPLKIQLKKCFLTGSAKGFFFFGVYCFSPILKGAHFGGAEGKETNSHPSALLTQSSCTNTDFVGKEPLSLR